jgi:hypothetical protein
VVDACPNRPLVAAVRDGLDEAIDHFTRAPVAGVGDWDLLAVRYRDLRSAVDAGDPDRVVAAIDVLYQLPSDAAG